MTFYELMLKSLSDMLKTANPCNAPYMGHYIRKAVMISGILA